MNKILLVGPLGKVGGLSKFVREFLSSDIPYEVIHFNNVRPLKNSIKNNSGIGYTEIFNAGFLRFLHGTIITLKNLFLFPIKLIIINPQIVHLVATTHFVFWEDTFYIIASKLFKKKIVVHFLGAFDDFYKSSSNTQREIIIKVLKLSDYLIVLTYKVELMLCKFGIKNVKVMPSSINLKPIETRIKSSFIDKAGSCTILFLGGFDAIKKGVFDIINAAKILINNNKNFQIIICTSKKIEDLENEILINNLSNFINLLEWINEDKKFELLITSHIFILPSYDEGVPYSIIEAMAFSLPIVATNVGGIPEVLVNNVNGFLINPGDYKNLAEKLSTLIDNEGLRNEFGKNNLEKVHEYYSFEKNILEIKNIYKLLLK